MKLEFIVEKENHQSRIDDFAFMHHISKKALKDIKMRGDILVNGVHKTVRYLLQENETVTFIFPKEVNHIQPIKIPLKIVYEDDYLIVLDKQKDIACIPTRTHPTYTIANGLSYYYRENHINSTIHIINRLDKETRGLMLVAKSRYVHDLMGKAHIHRAYRCHVEGKIGYGDIHLPIYKDGHQMRRIIDERGKKSLTHYSLLKYKENVSYVKCVLETGRTHQIRVHMDAIGHPLIGDSLYGGKIGEFDLESYQICFYHPIKNKYIFIQKNKH